MIRVDEVFPDGTRDDARGTVYVVTGGGGSPLHGFGPPAWYDAYRNATNHFVEVAVDGASVSLRALDARGRVLDSFTR